MFNNDNAIPSLSMVILVLISALCGFGLILDSAYKELKENEVILMSNEQKMKNVLFDEAIKEGKIYYHLNSENGKIELIEDINN